MAPELISSSLHGQRTLAAIVITDGVDFSARMSVDEELTLGLIHRDLQMMQHQCEEHKGQVLKSTGDGLLMYFVSAAQAVSSAIAIQQQLADLAAHRLPEDVLMHRIGIHLGDVFLTESDVMGNGVNIAARLQTQAQPGGICMSQTVYDVVKSQLALKAHYMGALHLKNIRDPIPAYHLLPRSDRFTHIETQTSQPDQDNINRDGSNLIAADFSQTPSPTSSAPAADRPTASGCSITRMDGDWGAFPVVAREVDSNLDRDLKRAPKFPPGGQGEITAGELIHDRYWIQQSLGQGGFGRTYLAKDTHRFDDWCVLKEFMPLNTSDYVVEKARTLFEREARALYRLNHPQIPKFLAWFTYGHRLFIVQEYVQGCSYSRLLQTRLQQGKLFSETDIVQWLYDLLMVLDYLHNQGIVHRDISTDNVMQPDHSPKPVLIDFGLVKQTVSDVLAQQAEANGLATPSHKSFVGKIGYAPPEQIRMGQCFPSSDLYALAVTALVLLTGRQPNMLLDPNSLSWTWRSHVSVSNDFAQLINRMLAEKPQDRYPSASAALCAIHDSSLIQQITLRPIETQIQAQACEMGLTPSLSGKATPQTDAEGGGLSFVASSETQLDADFLEACRRSLIQCVGPIANYLLTDLQGSQPGVSREQFVQLLVQEIPDLQQADAFQSSMQQYLQRQPQSRSQASGSDAELDEAFLERCQRELAQCIGPMASFILDDVMLQVRPTTSQELIRAIATEIPDPQKAQEFETAMQAQ